MFFKKIYGKFRYRPINSKLWVNITPLTIKSFKNSARSEPKIGLEIGFSAIHF